MENYKKITLDVDAMDAHISGKWLYVVEDEWNLVRYDIEELISSEGKSTTKKESLTTTLQDYSLDLYTAGNYVFICTTSGLLQFNILTGELKNVFAVKAYNITAGSDAVYVSFGDYAGLVRFRITDEGLVKDREIFPYSLSSIALGDKFIFNLNYKDLPYLIRDGYALPAISLLSDDAKEVINAGNEPICFIGHNMMFIFKDFGAEIYVVKNFNPDKKIDAWELIKIPVDISHIFDATGDILSYRGFRNGLVLEFYDSVIFVDETGYMTLSDEQIMEFDVNNEKDMMCIVRDESIDLYVHE